MTVLINKLKLSALWNIYQTEMYRLVMFFAVAAVAAGKSPILWGWPTPLVTVAPIMGRPVIGPAFLRPSVVGTQIIAPSIFASPTMKRFAAPSVPCQGTIQPIFDSYHSRVLSKNTLPAPYVTFDPCYELQCPYVHCSFPNCFTAPFCSPPLNRLPVYYAHPRSGYRRYFGHPC